MADVFSTQVITAVGLRLAATATSSNPIVWTGALSCATVPQDPEDKSAYTGITGEINTASATKNVARMVVGFTNNGQQPQQVKAIALLGRLASWQDSDAVIAAYCYDNDSAIVFPATDMQRTRFAFNLIFNGVSTVTVTQTGDLTVADSERFVSCHIPGDPSLGEEQSILGDKTWEDQQDFNEVCRFHDTVVMQNVYPEDTVTYDLGASNARWNAFYASSADITGNISSSGRVTCATALVQGSVRADFVNARSKLALKASTFVGTADEENNKYTMLVSGGAIDGIYGGLTILPQAQLTDASTGTTYEQNVDVYIGAQDSKFQSIHVVGANIDYLFNKYWSNAGRQWRFGALSVGGSLIPNHDVAYGNTSIDLGSSSYPFNDLYVTRVCTNLVCDGSAQYGTKTLGTASMYWYWTFTANAAIKNTLVMQDAVSAAITPSGTNSTNTTSAINLLFGVPNVNGILECARLGNTADTYHLDNVEISNSKHSTSGGAYSVPVGGMILAMAGQAWMSQHTHSTIFAGNTIEVQPNRPWFVARAVFDPTTGQQTWDSYPNDTTAQIPDGHYRAVCTLNFMIPEVGQAITNMAMPVLLQRID